MKAEKERMNRQAKFVLGAGVAAVMSLAAGDGVQAATFSQAVQALGPTAFWEFEDASSTDGATAASTVNSGSYSGTYKKGSEHAGGVTFVPSATTGLGQAAYFSNTATDWAPATTDRVLLNWETCLRSDNYARTLMFWAKADFSQDTKYHLAVQYGRLEDTHYFGASVNSTGDGGYSGSGMALSTWGANSTSGTTSSFLDGQWHFFCATVTPSSSGTTVGTVRLYADGQLQSTNIQSVETWWNDDYTMIVGGVRWDNSNLLGWRGAIDEVAAFQKTLTDQEITGLYNAAAVPEPAAVVLLVAGVLGLAVRARRKQR